MKEEIRVEIEQEHRAEIKASREAFEREMRNELRGLRDEKSGIVRNLERSQADIDDLKKRLEVELAKNKKTKERK